MPRRSLATAARCPSWVKPRRTQCEHIFRFAPEPGHCSTWSALRICETIPQIKLTQPRGTTLINMGVAARIIAGLYFGREIFVRSPWLFF
jgi:hypothetical protein